MSEYWKSTPNYWCKFCSQYVRDTSLERKNHEASAKHQNNIQRSLRELHKNKQHEERDKQRAKDEVARLNGMFGGKGVEPKEPFKSTAAPGQKATHSPSPALNTAAQRRAHAEQLATLGVELPEELKKEVTGVGNYHVVNERAVEGGDRSTVSVNRSLAEIVAEAKRQEEDVEVGPKTEIKAEEDIDTLAKGTFKRKAEDDEDIRDEEAAPKRKAWGSNIKTYPGSEAIAENGADLDALLSGVKKKEKPSSASVKHESADDVKEEEESDISSKNLEAIPDSGGTGVLIKQEDAVSAAAPAIVFKKRKGKK